MRSILAFILVAQFTSTALCCANEPIGQVRNSVGISFARIPAGKGVVGSPLSEPGRGRGEERHDVEFQASYHLGVHEVTQQQFQRVMAANPSAYSQTGELRDRVKGIDTAKFPVDSVSWHDAVEFCRRLSALPDERAAGRRYRLPTEAEWEYAVRAGSKTTWHFNDDHTTLAQHAWFGRDRADNRPREVGSAIANPWGLHDMYGNLWEWCADGDRADVDSDQRCAIRGGSWFSTIANCRSASRAMDPASVRERDTGFRVLLEIAIETP